MAPDLLPEKSSAAATIGSYLDAASGYRIIVARPSERPDLWEKYLAGAGASYRRHGVERVLEYDAICDGRTTALFFLAVDANGNAVGGMRAQGAYRHPDEAHALQEWAGRPGTSQVWNEISARIGAGVIEMKTGWVSDEADNRNELSNALARMFVHAMSLLGVRHAFCTVAIHAVRRWATTGGVISRDVTPVAYPDDRYLTTLMWWDRLTLADLTAPHQLARIMDESAALSGTQTPAPRSEHHLQPELV